jgi:hypothetical protein
LLAAATALGAGEFAVVGGVAGELEQGLGAAGLFGEQGGVVRRRKNGAPGSFQCGLEPFARNHEIRFREGAVVRFGPGSAALARRATNPGMQKRRRYAPGASPVVRLNSRRKKAPSS